MIRHIVCAPTGVDVTYLPPFRHLFAFSFLFSFEFRWYSVVTIKNPVPRRLIRRHTSTNPFCMRKLTFLSSSCLLPPHNYHLFSNLSTEISYFHFYLHHHAVISFLHTHKKKEKGKPFKMKEKKGRRNSMTTCRSSGSTWCIYLRCCPGGVRLVGHRDSIHSRRRRRRESNIRKVIYCQTRLYGHIQK